MMDVLLQITTAHHLVPSGHTIEALSMAPSLYHNEKILPYKPNTAIGTLDTQHIRVVPKDRNFGSATQRTTSPGHKPFESTFRLKVHLPRNQLFVYRVSMKVRLDDVMRKVCDEKNLDATKYEFRHPDNLDKVLDPKRTLSDYNITEIHVVAKGSTRLSSAFSASDIMALRHKDEERKTKTGLFGLFKKTKTTNGSGSLSSENRSISPTQSDDSRSVTPPVQQQIMKTEPEKPKPPQRKRRPAPKPPQQPQPPQQQQQPQNNEQSENLDKLAEKKTDNGLIISHSRNSSDSSGYHEASILSDNANTSLPRPRPQTLIDIGNEKLHGEHSRSTGNLTNMLAQSKSTCSLAVTGRKKKAPPPPPALKSASSATSLQKPSPLVASPVEKPGESSTSFNRRSLSLARMHGSLGSNNSSFDNTTQSEEQAPLFRKFHNSLTRRWSKKFQNSFEAEPSIDEIRADRFNRFKDSIIVQRTHQVVKQRQGVEDSESCPSRIKKISFSNDVKDINDDSEKGSIDIEVCESSDDSETLEKEAELKKSQKYTKSFKNIFTRSEIKTGKVASSNEKDIKSRKTNNLFSIRKAKSLIITDISCNEKYIKEVSENFEHDNQKEDINQEMNKAQSVIGIDDLSSGVERNSSRFFHNKLRFSFKRAKSSSEIDESNGMENSKRISMVGDEIHNRAGIEESNSFPKKIKLSFKRTKSTSEINENVEVESRDKFASCGVIENLNTSLTNAPNTFQNRNCKSKTKQFNEENLNSKTSKNPKLEKHHTDITTSDKAIKVAEKPKTSSKFTFSLKKEITLIKSPENNSDSSEDNQSYKLRNILKSEQQEHNTDLEEIGGENSKTNNNFNTTLGNNEKTVDKGGLSSKLRFSFKRDGNKTKSEKNNVGTLQVSKSEDVHETLKPNSSTEEGHTSKDINKELSSSSTCRFSFKKNKTQIKSKENGFESTEDSQFCKSSNFLNDQSVKDSMPKIQKRFNIFRKSNDVEKTDSLKKHENFTLNENKSNYDSLEESIGNTVHSAIEIPETSVQSNKSNKLRKPKKQESETYLEEPTVYINKSTTPKPGRRFNISFRKSVSIDNYETAEKLKKPIRYRSNKSKSDDDMLDEDIGFPEPHLSQSSETITSNNSERNNKNSSSYVKSLFGFKKMHNRSISMDLHQSNTNLNRATSKSLKNLKDDPNAHTKKVKPFKNIEEDTKVDKQSFKNLFKRGRSELQKCDSLESLHYETSLSIENLKNVGVVSQEDHVITRKEAFMRRLSKRMTTEESEDSHSDKIMENIQAAENDAGKSLFSKMYLRSSSVDNHIDKVESNREDADGIAKRRFSFLRTSSKDSKDNSSNETNSGSFRFFTKRPVTESSYVLENDSHNNSEERTDIISGGTVEFETPCKGEKAVFKRNSSLKKIRISLGKNDKITETKKVSDAIESCTTVDELKNNITNTENMKDVNKSFQQKEMDEKDSDNNPLQRTVVVDVNETISVNNNFKTVSVEMEKNNASIHGLSSINMSYSKEQEVNNINEHKESETKHFVHPQYFTKTNFTETEFPYIDFNIKTGDEKVNSSSKIHEKHLKDIKNYFEMDFPCKEPSTKIKYKEEKIKEYIETDFLCHEPSTKKQDTSSHSSNNYLETDFPCTRPPIAIKRQKLQLFEHGNDRENNPTNEAMTSFLVKPQSSSATETSSIKDYSRMFAKEEDFSITGDSPAPKIKANEAKTKYILETANDIKPRRLTDRHFSFLENSQGPKVKLKALRFEQMHELENVLKATKLSALSIFQNNPDNRVLRECMRNSEISINKERFESKKKSTDLNVNFVKEENRLINKEMLSKPNIYVRVVNKDKPIATQNVDHALLEENSTFSVRYPATVLNQKSNKASKGENIKDESKKKNDFLCDDCKLANQKLAVMSKNNETINNDVINCIHSSEIKLDNNCHPQSFIVKDDGFRIKNLSNNPYQQKNLERLDFEIPLINLNSEPIDKESYSSVCEINQNSSGLHDPELEITEGNLTEHFFIDPNFIIECNSPRSRLTFTQITKETYIDVPSDDDSSSNEYIPLKLGQRKRMAARRKPLKKQEVVNGNVLNVIRNKLSPKKIVNNSLRPDERTEKKIIKINGYL